MQSTKSYDAQATGLVVVEEVSQGQITQMTQARAAQPQMYGDSNIMNMSGGPQDNFSMPKKMAASVLDVNNMAKLVEPKEEENKLLQTAKWEGEP